MNNDFPRNEVHAAIAVIHDKLRDGCSEQVAERVRAWMDALSPTGEAPEYFLQPSMFPMLLLPAWMSRSLDVWEERFQSDLVYSSVNAYYSIRLLDNVMDGHQTCEKELLPLSAFFHAEFQSTYQRYFDVSHPFWNRFHALWLQSADVVVREAGLATMDFAAFRDIAAGKLSAAKIPLLAVYHRAGRRTDLPRWLALFDELAAWWQFLDDLMDWYVDSQRCACTYFLCEAERRKNRDEPVMRWVAREGWRWGLDSLEDWLEQLKRTAGQIGSDELLIFLEGRCAVLLQSARNLLSGMQGLEAVAVAMEMDEFVQQDKSGGLQWQ